MNMGQKPLQHVLLNKILTHKHHFGILDLEQVTPYFLMK